MKLVIASNNKGKIREIKAIVGGFFDEINSLKELGIDIEIEETGITFVDNALIKAETVAKMTNCCALADDSGLCVGALNGAPGVFSARYAGEGHDDDANNALLLKKLTGKTDRSAYFESAIALVYPNGRTVVAQGKTYGKILDAPKGSNGFGYDPLFYSDDLGKSFGVASDEEKNQVSHRARALNELKQKLISAKR